ncbi:MAG: T9SS type A sorting domain-containing protein [Bacteroidales bacterium]|nr:T9SS type A sorting domain-containing protein [Bacteroidales bacterium]
MKRYLILLFIYSGLFGNGMVNAQWKTEKVPTRNNLNAVSVTSGTNLWIAGNKGTILSKSNGTWTEFQKTTAEDLRSIFMTSETNGWAVGDNGTIIHYDGKTWKAITPLTDHDLSSVFFKDQDNGIAVGDNGTILIFHKGTWSAMNNDIRGDLFAGIYFKDDVWLGGGLECVNFAIKRMSFSNKGLAPVSNFDLYASINSICILSPDNGWAAGSPGVLLHFDGNQWEQALTDEKFSSLRSLCFSDENTGISVGYGGTILCYSDKKWTKEKSNTTRTLNGTAIKENIFYAVGDSGTVITKTLPKKDIDTKNSEQLADNIEVYPNPCDDILKVKISGEDVYPKVTISVTNSNGQIFLKNEILNWYGDQEISVATSSLKNGLYSIQADIGGKILKNKLIILH